MDASSKCWHDDPQKLVMGSNAIAALRMGWPTGLLGLTSVIWV